jgi:hypothetical protein
MKNLFNDKYQDDILGTNSCFDRIVLKGSIIPVSYEKGLIRISHRLLSHAEKKGNSRILVILN